MILLPPITGDRDLDAYNLELYNYLMGREAPVSFNKGTGVIKSLVDDQVIGYLYRYLHVKFANDTIGTSFSNTATGRSFYGLNNSDNPVESSDYFDYKWVEVDAPFSGSNKLFYRVLGGRSIDLFVGSAAPDSRWVEMTGDSVDLDDIVLPGTIITDMLADGAVTEPKLAANSVSNVKIQDAAVTADKLDTTGTPSASTYLNGNFEWASPVSGFFLEQSVANNDSYIPATADGGHLYKESGSPTTVIQSIESHAVNPYPIGTTLTVVTVYGDIIIRIDSDEIVMIPSGVSTPAILVSEYGKATLLKVENTKWVVEGYNIAATADPGSIGSLLLTSEDSFDILAEDGKELLVEGLELLFLSDESEEGLLAEDGSSLQVEGLWLSHLADELGEGLLTEDGNTIVFSAW